MIKSILQWLLWCVEFKTIMPWSVHTVSMRELTEEEYNYPASCEFPQEFFDAMESIMDAVETTDFDFDRVKKVSGSGMFNFRICGSCGGTYSTLMCPCIVEWCKENNTHHILCNLDPRLPVDECRQCIGFYKEALELDDQDN